LTITSTLPNGQTSLSYKFPGYPTSTTLSNGQTSVIPVYPGGLPGIGTAAGGGFSGSSIFAHSIQIRWQSTTGSSPAPTPGDLLSPGAIAGISISVTLAFLCILLGAFFYIRRRREGHLRAIDETGAAGPAQDEHKIHGLYLKPELDAEGTARKNNTRRTEERILRQTEIYELDGHIGPPPNMNTGTDHPQCS
jgi:hypothetical protein